MKKLSTKHLFHSLHAFIFLAMELFLVVPAVFEGLFVDQHHPDRSLKLVQLFAIYCTLSLSNFMTLPIIIIVDITKIVYQKAR